MSPIGEPATPDFYLLYSGVGLTVFGSWNVYFVNMLMKTGHNILPFVSFEFAMAKASAGANVIIAHMNTIFTVNAIGLNIVIPFKELVILTYIMRRM